MASIGKAGFASSDLLVAGGLAVAAVAASSLFKGAQGGLTGLGGGLQGIGQGAGGFLGQLLPTVSPVLQSVASVPTFLEHQIGALTNTPARVFDALGDFAGVPIHATSQQLNQFGHWLGRTF